MNQEIDNLLIKSAKRALGNLIPQSLISASVEMKKKEIQWLCIFDQIATDDDIEFGSIAGTEIIADFTSEYGMNEMLEKLDPNAKVRTLKNIVYSK